jgi:pSer/pThr/pTyr-binding forkhead associated (FHA) protein/tetratricopeptide (TPR) repeat protein
VKLLIKDDSGKTTAVNMARDEITIGRKDGNTIRLTEKNVSRTHARFLKKGEEIHVEDLSRYGVRVNGERIQQSRRVGAGDVIVIGDYQLSLEGVKAVEDLPVSPAAQVQPAAAAVVDPAKAKKKAELDAAARERIMAAKRELGDETQEAPLPKQAKDGKGEAPKGEKKPDEERKSKGAGKKRIGAAHPTLVAVTTHLAGTEYPLEQETSILGRTGENDVKVDHHSISRNHAKVVVKDGQVRMVDLQSKNGIRVNGEFWEESILKSGDIIELGKVQFRFVAKGEEFVFRPEDYTEKEADDELMKPPGSGKTWLVMLLLVAAGGLAALYFLVIAKPTEVNNVNVPATAATAPQPDAAAAKPPETAVAAVPVAPGTAQPADAAAAVEATKPADVAAPPEQPKVDHTEAINKHLATAQTAAAEKRWDDAKKALDEALALDKERAEVKALSERVTSESNVLASLTAARASLAKSELAEAWKVLQTLQSTPADSAYRGEVDEARKTVGTAIANQLVDQAKAAHTKKNWAEAIGKAEEALTYVPNHPEAPGVITKARKARLEQQLKEQQEAAKNPKPKDPKPKDPPPDASAGKSGEDLNKEARALSAQDPAAALKLYEQAVAKGYVAAYKSIGILKSQRGDKAGAIAAYKSYLAKRANAPDADTIREIIVQLGGTP